MPFLNPYLNHHVSTSKHVFLLHPHIWPQSMCNGNLCFYCPTTLPQSALTQRVFRFRRLLCAAGVLLVVVGQRVNKWGLTSINKGGWGFAHCCLRLNTSLHSLHSSITFAEFPQVCQTILDTVSSANVELAAKYFFLRLSNNTMLFAISDKNSCGCNLRRNEEQMRTNAQGHKTNTDHSLIQTRFKGDLWSPCCKSPAHGSLKCFKWVERILWCLNLSLTDDICMHGLPRSHTLRFSQYW